MKSHAYVERIEDGIAVLEVRLSAIDEDILKEGDTKRYLRPSRKFVEIPEEKLKSELPDVKEMDVIVVEHTYGILQSICYIDYAEKERRLKRAQERRERFNAKIKKQVQK